MLIYQPNGVALAPQLVHQLSKALKLVAAGRLCNVRVVMTPRQLFDKFLLYAAHLPEVLGMRALQAVVDDPRVGQQGAAHPARDTVCAVPDCCWGPLHHCAATH